MRIKYGKAILKTVIKEGCDGCVFQSERLLCPPNLLDRIPCKSIIFIDKFVDRSSAYITVEASLGHELWRYKKASAEDLMLLDSDIADNYLTKERVIFNGPATIVISPSGKKTVVKCAPGDTFDPRYGYLLCKFIESSGMTRTQVSKKLKSITRQAAALN